MAEIGSIIDNKYKVLDEVGRGGMSVVFLARDKRLEKLWAVKEIRNVGDPRKRQTIIDSLKSEARLMRDLDHPAIVRIVDIIDEQDSLYVVMDYIDGESLLKQIFPNGKKQPSQPVPEKKVINWALQICGVLQYLHSQNPPVIYYDLKPDNIMLRNEGDIRLIDFGAARKYSSDPAVMNSYKILGTPGYAAPEQYRTGSETDMRSDIYTFGMTLHFLLTGNEPKVTKNNKNPRPKPIREFIPSLSSGLEQIIIKCTQMDPKDRYQNCDELMYALEHHNEMDDQYKAKQQSTLKKFMISAIISGALLLTSGISVGAAAIINNNDYDNLLSTGGTYQESLEACEKAIEIKGNKEEGYLRMLSLFRDNENEFGERESQLISGLYESNKSKFRSNSTEFIDLNFEIGRAYLFMYVGQGDDDSFRTRILKSTDPYFNNVIESGVESYENYEMANSFCKLGQFYRQYIGNSDTVKEPTKTELDQLIDSFSDCMDSVDKYDTNESSYIKLVVYQQIENQMHEYASTFAASRVNEGKVTALIDDIVKRTNALSVTAEKSQEKKNEILTNATSYKEDIITTYKNTSEGKTNGTNS